MNVQKVTLFTAMALIFLSRPAIAVEEPVRSRVVDAIVLHDSTRLLGTVQQSVGDQSVSLLMRVSWLRAEYPELLKLLSDSEAGQDDATKDAIAEINEYLKSRVLNGDRELERTGFLREQIERLQSEERIEPDLVLLNIPSKQIRRRFLQRADRRAIAFAAILNDVPDTETLTEQELRQRMMELPEESLLTELPSNPSKSLTIADRILIDADRLFGRVTRVIRQGDRYISESNEGGNVTAIAAQLLSDGLHQQLQQLLSEGPVAASQLNPEPMLDGRILDAAATQTAKEEKADVVELTSMRISPANSTASVTIEVYRQRNGDVWHQVLLASAQATSTDITAQQKMRIAQDPRVKEVLQLFKSLGAANEISQAINIGAVVQVAQQRAKKLLSQCLSEDSQTLRIHVYTLPAKAD